MEAADQMRELAVRWTKAQPMVSAFIRSAVPDYHDAEDLIQEVAQSIASHFDRYDGERPFVAWAIGIARHKIIDHQRQRYRDRHVFDSETLACIADAYAGQIDELENVKDALVHCLDQCQGRARKLLEMRYMREMTPTQIARKLDISVNLVSVTLHRVRAFLGRCIERRLAGQGGSP